MRCRFRRYWWNQQHFLADFYPGWLRLAGDGDRDAFRRTLIGWPGNLRHTVDPDGALATVLLHDAADADDPRDIRRFHNRLLAGLKLCTLFGRKKQAAQPGRSRDRRDRERKDEQA